MVCSHVKTSRILSKHQYTVVIYLGPVQFVGYWFSYMSYVGISEFLPGKFSIRMCSMVISVHLSLNSFISLMLSMVYRYFSIRFCRFTVKTSVALCLVGYSLPLFILVSCANLVVSTSISVNKEILNGMVENLESYHMVVSTNISNQPPVIVLLLAVTFGLIPIYFVMYWCRHQIYKTLKETRSVHSASTRDNARRLVNVRSHVSV